MPKIREQKGCERCEFFADDEEGDYGLVVIWRSMEDADNAASVIGPIMMPALAKAGASASIRIFETYEPK